MNTGNSNPTTFIFRIGIPIPPVFIPRNHTMDYAKNQQQNRVVVWFKSVILSPFLYDPNFWLSLRVMITCNAETTRSETIPSLWLVMPLFTLGGWSPICSHADKWMATSPCSSLNLENLLRYPGADLDTYQTWQHVRRHMTWAPKHKGTKNYSCAQDLPPGVKKNSSICFL